MNRAIITEIKAFALLSIVLVRSHSLASSPNETSDKMDAEGYFSCGVAFLAFNFPFTFSRLFNISHPFVLKNVLSRHKETPKAFVFQGFRGFFILLPLAHGFVTSTE